MESITLTDISPAADEIVQSTPEMTNQIEEIENSELKKIANDVLGALKYSYTTVATNLDRPFAANSLESALKSALQSRPKAVRETTAALANEMLKSSSMLRTHQFGRVAQIDQTKFMEIGFRNYANHLEPIKIDPKLLGFKTPRITIPADAFRNGRFELTADHLNSLAMRRDIGAEAGIFDETRFSDIFDSMTRKHLLTGAGNVSRVSMQVANPTDKLGFYITKIKCVDETNPEWFGSDEIALGGVSVDETGDTKKIREKYIGGGFDDGDSRTYSNWRYHWFSLREGQSWPKSYSMSLLLAEKDNGGLSDAINRIWQNVKAAVLALLDKAATEAGVAIGAFLGSAEAGAILGKIIGAAVKWVIQKFMDWLINAFKDDIFPMFTTMVTIPSTTARWRYANGRWGNPRSPRQRAHFYGHGGHYYVEYYWQISA